MSLYVAILFLNLKTYMIDIIVIQSYTWTVEMYMHYLGLTQCDRKHTHTYLHAGCVHGKQ